MRHLDETFFCGPLLTTAKRAVMPRSTALYKEERKKRGEKRRKRNGRTSRCGLPCSAFRSDWRGFPREHRGLPPCGVPVGFDCTGTRGRGTSIQRLQKFKPRNSEDEEKRSNKEHFQPCPRRDWRTHARSYSSGIGVLTCQPSVFPKRSGARDAVRWDFCPKRATA